MGIQPSLSALVVAVAVLVVIRLEVFCPKDIARAKEWEVGYLPKPVWAGLCLLCIPFGGIFYLYYGRPR